MDRLDRLDKLSIIEFIKSCQCPKSGGISACIGHDPHILYTLSAVQVSYDKISRNISLKNSISDFMHL